MKLDTRTTKSAVYLIDEKYGGSEKNSIPSGWDYDQRGSATAKEHEKNVARNLTTSSEGKYPLTLARTFMVLNKGKASFAHTVQLKSNDGYFIELYSTDNKTAFSIAQKNGMFTVNGEMIACPAVNKTYTIGVEFDLDNKSADVSINGVLYGTYKVLGNDMYKIKSGYKAGSTGSCSILYTGLWINYLVCDRNLIRADSAMPYDWTDKCENGGSASTSYYYEGAGIYTYQLCAAKSSTACVAKSFEKTSGKVCFDIRYFTKNPDGENIKLSLTALGKECVSVFDNGSKSFSNSTPVLREHHPFVWQRIRIDADTASGKAFIWHNGKKCGYIDFDQKTDFFDGISISYAPENGGVMKFTDVFVYEIQPEPEDYPKPPVLPTRKENIYTGMNICSLWREGTHYGWENIINFKENMPILGPYDEGLPEVADWEIKYMVEHGLNCEFYCWFGNQQNAPFVKTYLSDAMDGHFYAKYGDMMKFAIIWEISNCRKLTSVEEFKTYYVPFWIDHYFSDERYFNIDGIAFLAVFCLDFVIGDLGGPDKLKECLDYLESELKKIGYKGLAVISASPPSENAVKSGISGYFAYHWGCNGYNPKHQQLRIKSQIDLNQLHVVPTLSVGYNDIAWRVAERVPYISTENMGKLLGWMVDDVLASYKDKPEEWKRKLLMFSTWNEFGEGTFISPTGLNGFGYLNEMRKAVTKEGDCFESDLPSEDAYNRLGYLYPRGRKPLITPQNIPLSMPSEVVGKIEFTGEDAIKNYVKSWKTENATAEFKNGKLCGYSNVFDPQIILDVDFEAEGIDAICVKLRAAEGTTDENDMMDNAASWRVFFGTDTDPELSETKAASPQAVPTTVIISKNQNWKGRIKTLRLDPTANFGVFELESITFLKQTTPDIETYVDGKMYESRYQSKVEDGEIYVSFEPFRDFHRLMNLYYEWDDDTRTLMTEFDGKTYYWTENSDIVKNDCKDIKMKKPLELYDGLPYLPMSALAEIAGCSYTFEDNKLNITT